MVAIVGGVAEYWGGVPWTDPTCQVWTVPRVAPQLPRVTRVYEMHSPDVAAHFAEGVRATRAAVVTWESLPKLPRGPLSNSIAVMLAHAGVEGVNDVGIWGAPQTGEYQSARDAMLYWIGWLTAAGVRVHDHSDLVNWGERYGAKANEGN